ncbi:inositol 1,4,5-trisphosphate receptor-interacting protein-like 2 [Brienomyrus brachyistius]|uniref:inositol 1,4,5-trisphosphate receptor-interacting protein-like 2 n=1 Tax=Brienomyrus brachyistius TaxID=42636 RepID=UPI0020B24FC6|nr:inositol 1,4,5-trisphosphate receptor-interacting protein-like 2 [Brienomyrus brachyistius]
MTVYTLNLRVFWPLVTFVLTVLLLLLHSSLRRVPGSAPADCPDKSVGPLLLALFALGFILRYFFKYCSSRLRRTKRVFRELPEVTCRVASSRKELLESYYERHVCLSPHVLGHSKAHVAKLVSELVRAGRTKKPPEACFAFRGDFVQIGSCYEEHKVSCADCFDILVPLHLPCGLKLAPVTLSCGEGWMLPLCSLEMPRASVWLREHKAFAGSFLSLSGTGGAYRLSPDAVLRWFYLAIQRCLAAVRQPFEWHCSLGLSLCDSRVMLRLTPLSDYVCCHICMGVRLIPAVPLADGSYLVGSACGPQQGELWTPYFPRQEQKLLGWLRNRLPVGSCHLKCLQMIKALRDLGGQALDSHGGGEWREVLSSYSLKTAWLHLLLTMPPERWRDHCFLDRLEDLLQNLKESLRQRELRHMFLGGNTELLPSFLTLPKLFRDTAPSNLLVGFHPTSLDLVCARLSYFWAHLHWFIRLGQCSPTAGVRSASGPKYS